MDWTSAINKGSVVQAKRKVFPHAAWSRGNLQPQWETATVLKIRTSSGEALLDVQYVDGYVEKKMPMNLWFSPKIAQSSTSVNIINMVSVLMLNFGRSRKFRWPWFDRVCPILR